MVIRTKKTKAKGRRQRTRLTVPSYMYQKMSRIFIASIPYIPSIGRYNITLCHKNKFIWFRVPKVGSRTILDVFVQANVNLDAEHPYSCHYPVNQYKDYFKFAFVRNPWDRLVSCWLDKVIGYNYFGFSAEKLSEMQRFENFVDFVGQQDIDSCDGHIRTQSKLIDLNNIDYIGRIENFNEHLSAVIQIIGLDSVVIGRKNANLNRGSYEQYYDDKLARQVAEIYRMDISIFKYDFATEQ